MFRFFFWFFDNTKGSYKKKNVTGIVRMVMISYKVYFVIYINLYPFTCLSSILIPDFLTLFGNNSNILVAVNFLLILD